MVAVSEEYLRTLRAITHPSYDRAEIEAGLLAFLQAGLPDWTAAPGDILRRALPLIAEYIFLHGETENANWDQGTLLRSTGRNLQIWGLEVGLQPSAGESDDDYRLRIANAGSNQGLGSLPYIENQAREFQDTIIDAQAVTSANRQDVRLYALKADHVALTAEENTALLAYLNGRGKQMAGVEVTLPAVTQTAFTIELQVTHPVRMSGDVVAADARAGVYRFLEAAQMIGQPVYRDAIARFAEPTDNPEIRVAVTSPNADLPIVAGTVYTCASTTTDVVITTVAA